MFRDKIAIDIGSSKIKIIVGEKLNVKNAVIIDTPLNSYEDDKIVNEELIKDAIKKAFAENNITVSRVSFSIGGQDIMVRHMEIPIIDKKQILESVKWEVGQYLPENGEFHYIDYEILGKTENSEKKVYNLLVAAAPKEKIDSYVRLSSLLGLKLISIDVSSNCAARAFRILNNDKLKSKSVGVIDIGVTKSSIIILEDGRLFVEREVPFGTANIEKEISRKLDGQYSKEYLYIKFDFQNIGENDELDLKIRNLFENVFSAFIKVIQFYSVNKIKRQLDYIYIIGGGAGIKGLDSYVSSYFGSKAESIVQGIKLPYKLKLPKDCDIRYFVDALGLLLRKE